MKMPMKDIQPDRIVGNGGALLPSQPLTIGDLFERFSRIRTPEDAFKFVETHGSLTLSGLRGKGDIVEELTSMRLGICAPSGERAGRSALGAGPKCTAALILGAADEVDQMAQSWVDFNHAVLRVRTKPPPRSRLPGVMQGLSRPTQAAYRFKHQDRIIPTAIIARVTSIQY